MISSPLSLTSLDLTLKSYLLMYIADLLFSLMIHGNTLLRSRMQACTTLIILGNLAIEISIMLRYV